ncbi:hypothetical protein GCM10008107_31530 [Psychrosphaera saromensis]|uniref:Uncharacterized protein n=1 Tax=Psychrosphaera saromensis TaxID=716813 RepID=A0A2S7UVV8_9GAMM|nr:hypothetical protein [Psychrosphaera saromensis]PQJ54124.1 hypothetical protein BTO11_10985 [Psychrosphaera saromensis]GHB79799.1 hypothetical protein GCM10008107_31530 [Psychrosphaera saromensis]GLQ12765.1 hypothetical protein GCM10007917_02200 [Psychrosphaera saromensis]
MKYVSYYDISTEGFFDGVLFPFILMFFFISIAVGLLISKKNYSGSDSETITKLKFGKVWAIAALFMVVTSLYGLINSKIENKNSFSNNLEIKTIEGKISKYTELKKEIGFSSFFVASEKFETFSPFRDCKYPKCGLFNNLNVRITYTHTFINNITKNDDKLFGVEVIKAPHENKILKIELKESDFNFITERNNKARQRCLNQGVCS